MKRIFVILLFLFSINQMSADFVRGYIVWFDCPATENQPSHSGWSVFEDLDGNGTIDWETTMDCNGNVCSEPYQQGINIIGNIGSAANRPNEMKEYTELTTPDGNKYWKIRSYNSITNQTYYIVTSVNQNPVLELLPPPPSVKSNSNQTSDNNTNKGNSNSIGKVAIYENQAYEYTVTDCSESATGKGWNMRTYNKITGATYYTVISCNGKTEIVYPTSSELLSSLDNSDINNSTLQIYPNPTNNIVNIDYVSDKQSNIAVSLLDVKGKPIIESIPYLVTQGSNSLVFDLKNTANGSYIVQIVDGKKIYSSQIIIQK